MTFVKTSELSGAALDWAVAVCEGCTPFSDGISWIIDISGVYWQLPKYSTDWAHGGPIIEREMLQTHHFGGEWRAYSYWSKGYNRYVHAVTCEACAPTLLVAAMRCYVASKLGDSVEIPDNLLEENHD